jgi:hypothetical protein
VTPRRSATLALSRFPLRFGRRLLCRDFLRLTSNRFRPIRRGG